MSKEIKNNELFLETLNTLLFSWGGDAPAEAVWTFNELIFWAEKEFSINVGIELKEDLSNSEELFDKLKSELKINE